MTKGEAELVFVPLGGVGEIGMNFALYGIGQGRKRQWLAVDCGVGFANDQLPGIDIILPDVRFIEEERKNLLGIVISHGHEDHIGALADLWPRLRAPVYTTPFTAQLITVRRLQEPGAPDIPIEVVPVGGHVSLGPFEVDFIPVAHSIPESHALAIGTPFGTVLHTGDWKMDPTPVVGSITDEARFRALGDAGVLAMVADSTNAVREGRSPSEADAGANLAKVIAEARGRVAVTTFASNVARMVSVAKAAEAAGREVVLVGRAMERVSMVARELGYLDGVREFRSVDTYGYLPRDKVVALITGSQGEPRAALSRIALDEHPDIALSPGDTVVFSARAIPGNEVGIGRIINALIRQGVEVITDRTHMIHVSGHPRRSEMADLLRWVRPRILLPVHGEALHMHEHAVLAEEVGVPEVVRCGNGDVVRLAPGPAEVVDEVPAARLYKDGKVLIEDASRTIADRRKLSFVGIVAVALALTDKGELAGDVRIESLGLPERTADGRTFDSIVDDAVLETFDTLPRARRRDPRAVEESILRGVRGTVAEAWGKKPIVRVMVVQV
ncbi:ribonuclease J [Blastochloris sulfoviridis]|uniref:Ribonuclease J n=1 Tax=Blastochloris sulfoviridis TaxID=50712 RepID=A0A5M6HYX7_9HYPH|nr:ribonuclease J [Blastochloris sulfoviridis]KAA5601124.1 ribonuclease J [Blastochloris sulfoviridis]